MSAITFNAFVSGHNLHAFSVFQGRRALFSLNVKSRPSFWIDGTTLKARLQYGEEVNLFKGVEPKEAENLLDAVTRAVRRHHRFKLAGRSVLSAVAIAVMATAIGYGQIRGGAEADTLQGVSMSNAQPNAKQNFSVPSARFQGLPQLRQHVPESPYFGSRQPDSAAQQRPATQIQAPAAPQSSAQASVKPETVSPGRLASNLKKAADRGYFTVPLSSGHARTLYVFADPECPNCQNFEPLFEALSAHYNVEIFPVTTIGKEKSASDIQPVLYLPKDQRKAAWDRLFSVDDGMREIGKKFAASAAQPTAERDAEKWKIAGQALSINDLAYHQYQIPGTPWVIADDGRHVPQSVMKDPDLMEKFMAEKPEQ